MGSSYSLALDLAKAGGKDADRGKNSYLKCQGEGTGLLSFYKKRDLTLKLTKKSLKKSEVS